METQNNKNIDQHFRKLAEEQKPKTFKNMDAIWDKVEKKLDQEQKRRVIPFWKYASVAAALLLLITLGSHFINNNPTNENKESNSTDVVVIDEEKIKEELNTNSETDLVVTEIKDQVKNGNIVDVQSVVKKDKKILDDFVENEVISPEITKENKSKSRQVESLVTVQAEEQENLFDINEINFKEELNKETFINNFISGTVVSAEDGLVIPGANITIKGTTRGTQTDLDGKY